MAKNSADQMQEPAPDAPDPAGPQTLQENGTLGALAEASGPKGRRRRIQLIDAGWSKNGRYYPADTLAEAARAGVYKTGAPMYIDHPTVTETAERPERSVKDLAARLVSDARFENGALVAEAELFGPWRPVINEMAEHIGVSIRAAGTLEYGEAEGREGPIVTQISEGISVDFVTSPARGGRILELIESARTEQQLAEARNIGAWLESRLHLSFTQLTDDMYGGGRLSRDERIGLSSAVGEALAAFTARIEADNPQLYKRDLWAGPDGDAEMDEAARAIAEGHGMTANDLAGALSDAVRAAHGGAKRYAWTCDHTDEWVVFRVDTDTGKGGGLYRQTYEVADGKVALTGKPAEVTAHTTYTPAGQPPSQPALAEETDRTDPDPDPTERVAENALGTPPADTEKETEGDMPDLTEAEARELTEALETAKSERQAALTEAAAARSERDGALREAARLRAAETARPIAVRMVTEADMPAAARVRVLDEALKDVPLTEGNTLDEAGFRARVDQLVQAEAAYLASLAEANGAGQVRGLGESQPAGDAGDREQASLIESELVAVYKRRGMSDEAARRAAAGRL